MQHVIWRNRATPAAVARVSQLRERKRPKSAIDGAPRLLCHGTPQTGEFHCVDTGSIFAGKFFYMTFKIALGLSHQVNHVLVTLPGIVMKCEQAMMQ